MIDIPLIVITRADGAAALPLGPVIGGALLALLLTFVAWPVSGHLITAAHEGGHALFGSAVGGSVVSVRMKSNRTAKTGVAGLSEAAGDVVAFAGYVSPSLFGVVGAILLDDGQVRALLWLSLFFLFLLLIQVRGLFSLVVVLATGGLVVLTLREASGGVQTVFAYTWTWFLLLGGARHVIDYQPSDDGGKDAKRSRIGADAQALQETTRVPAVLWMGLFWVVALAALVFGAAVLLGLIGQHAAG